MPSGSEWLSRATVIVVAICTLVVTGLVVRREVASAPDRVGLASQDPEMVDDWDELIAAGHRIGPSDAALTLLVFSDFECPACRALAMDILPRLERRYPGQVALVYRHWPLARHRLSYPAARAAECAAEQQSFAAYHNPLYEEQSTLGLKSFVDFAVDVGVPKGVGPWSALATEAGIAEVDHVAGCANRRVASPDIAAGTGFFEETQTFGTPTVIINGWRHPGFWSGDRLDSLITSYERDDA